MESDDARKVRCVPPFRVLLAPGEPGLPPLALLLAPNERVGLGLRGRDAGAGLPVACMAWR